MYFRKEQEAIVRQYIETRDERLYEEHIDALLNSIAYGVRARYKFKPKAYFTSRSVINDCKSLMWEKLLTNYDPNEGKAFSYLTTVAHHYFCAVARGRNLKQSTLYKTGSEIALLWENAHAAHNGAEEMMIFIEETRGFEMFMKNLLLETRQWNKERLKENDHKVIDAVEILIANCEDIEIFHKKAIYLYFREITGLKTKQVVTFLKKTKIRYQLFRKEWYYKWYYDAPLGQHCIIGQQDHSFA